jgi:hypothetical protein
MNVQRYLKSAMEDKMFVLHAVVMAVMLVVSIDATAQTQQSKPSARKPAGGQPKTAQQLFHDAFEASVVENDTKRLSPLV